MEWVHVSFVGPPGTEVVTWILAGPGCPDLSVVDELARLQLSARRVGGEIRLAKVCPELEDLLDLAGIPFEEEVPAVERREP